MRILLIEDSPRVANLVRSRLRSEGHDVHVATKIEEADTAIEAEHFDVAIVDVGLPDGSGIDWCRRRREIDTELRMLILTARSGVQDRVLGLNAGADDYLGKPFAMDELVARVRALARRGPRFTESSRTYGALVIDRERHAVTVAGKPLAMTPREIEIVALLAWRDGRVVARVDILESIWGDADESAAASLEVLVARIRKKLDECGVGDPIRTVRQVGYAWALERSARV